MKTMNMIDCGSNMLRMPDANAGMKRLDLESDHSIQKPEPEFYYP